MTSNYFEYNKPKTIQALRYHFISRREIKFMMVLVNVFAMLSAGLYYFKKISPTAFLLSSVLWFLMMIMFWFLLPRIIYRKSPSFKDQFKVDISATNFTLENQKGSRSWDWSELYSWMESPHFFHVYFSSTAFFIIPKEAFETEDLTKVRGYFKDNIKTNKK